MEAVVILLLCVVAAVSGQILSPMSSLGMGSGWGNPMWQSGVRYPGLMQTSHLSSMTYPTHMGWRSHPLVFRMAPSTSDKNVVSNLASDVLNIAKVPSSQEVLTHVALANPNPKPYLDTIADFLYEPQKARTVLTPVTSVPPVVPVAPFASMAPVAPVSTIASSADLQGMNLMRARATFADDCGPQDNARWERGMDWLY